MVFVYLDTACAFRGQGEPISGLRVPVKVIELGLGLGLGLRVPIRVIALGASSLPELARRKEAVADSAYFFCGRRKLPRATQARVLWHRRPSVPICRLLLLAPSTSQRETVGQGSGFE